jgi:hypothetical protein
MSTFVGDLLAGIKRAFLGLLGWSSQRSFAIARPSVDNTARASAPPIRRDVLNSLEARP